MNWLDFIYLGPTSIWVLSAAIFLSAIAWLTNTKRIISELKNTTSELRGITSELRDDTSKLKHGTSELTKEMGMTRKSIDNFYKTLQRVYSFWFPLVGNSE